MSWSRSSTPSSAWSIPSSWIRTEQLVCCEETFTVPIVTPEAVTAATTSPVTSWNCGLWSWLCTLTGAWGTGIDVLSGREVVPGARGRLEHRAHGCDGIRRAQDAARRAGAVEAEAHHPVHVLGP